MKKPKQLIFKNNFFIHFRDNRVYLMHKCNDDGREVVYGYISKNNKCFRCKVEVSKSLLTYVKLLQLGKKL